MDSTSIVESADHLSKEKALTEEDLCSKGVFVTEADAGKKDIPLAQTDASKKETPLLQTDAIKKDPLLTEANILPNKVPQGGIETANIHDDVDTTTFLDFQMQLWKILEKQVKLFTSGESFRTESNSRMRSFTLARP